MLHSRAPNNCGQSCTGQHCTVPAYRRPSLRPTRLAPLAGRVRRTNHTCCLPKVHHMPSRPSACHVTSALTIGCCSNSIYHGTWSIMWSAAVSLLHVQTHSPCTVHRVIASCYSMRHVSLLPRSVPCFGSRQPDDCTLSDPMLLSLALVALLFHATLRFDSRGESAEKYIVYAVSSFDFRSMFNPKSTKT